MLATENLVSLSNSIIKSLEKLQPGGPGWGLVKRLFREDVPAIPVFLPRIEIDAESLYSQLEKDSTQDLDDSQLAVFKECLRMPALMGVQGPPGTGKTMLLSFVGEGLVRSGKKIVLLAPTHQAINNALSIIKRLFPERQVIKVGDELRNESLDSSIPIVFKNKDIEEYPADTIFGMTFMAGLSRLMGVDRRPIDPNVVIIDEAGQLPLAQGVCTALCGAGSILLFGDDQQMPPVFAGDLSENEYAVSVFAQLRRSHPESISMLNITHRLNEELCQHIGDAFYPDAREQLRPSAHARDRYFDLEITEEMNEPTQQLLNPADAIVPGVFFREGLNIERMSTMSSSRDELGRPKASDRGTTVQTKWVKPVGVVQRVEPSSARDRGKSSANPSVLFSVNRRMRTRMSGGVRGGG